MTSPRSPHPSRVRFRLLLLAGATLAALVAAELGLRVLDLPKPSDDFRRLRHLGQVAGMFRSDPELHWLMKPGDPDEPANEFGLRGPLPVGPHLPRDFVVFCVGDSCTFGAGVRYDQTYGARLGIALQRAMPDRRVDVVLVAIGGYSSHQDRVLFDRLVERGATRLSPDLTILYTGLFNDYTPSIGGDDLERAHPPWLHLQRLFARAQESESEIQGAQADHVRGKRAEHPRVSLAQYRRNVEALAMRARELGSQVITVLPPRTPKMFQTYTDGRTYLDATREVAETLKIPVVEPMKRFEALLAEVPDGLRAPDDPWPCFVDIGHPSVLGHALIAEVLVESIRTVMPELREPSAAEVPVIDVTCLRTTLPAFHPGSITVETALARQVDRAWFGDVCVPQIEAIDDRHLRLDLPPLLIPGEHTLELRTTTGLTRARQRFQVDPISLSVHVETRDDGGIELIAEGTGPSGWQVGVWIQPGLREAPLATCFGPLHVDATYPGEQGAPHSAPFRFDRLPAAPMTSPIGANQRWTARFAVSASTPLPARVFLQAWLTDGERPWFGAISGVFELKLR